MSARVVPPLAPLHDLLLLVARVAWVVVAVAALAIVLFSFPSSLEHFRSVCTVTSRGGLHPRDSGRVQPTETAHPVADRSALLPPQVRR